MTAHFKDAVLNELADTSNVAQFVSFAPDLRLRFARLHGESPLSASPEVAIAALLRSSGEQSINVRSYDPETPESREFVYGLKSVDAVIANVQRLASQGLYTIANETIDVKDGGVSGVVLGQLIEFAPDDTPRAVEKPDVASLPRDLGLRLLSIVYGFQLTLDYQADERVEFSLHPQRRGVRHEHVIVWERRRMGSFGTARFVWPNRFSRLIGDKVFGLLVAHVLGLPVPHTTVFGRRVAPFAFGTATGTGEPWIRTSPMVQVPGFFSTLPRWTDPFALLQREDPDARQLASVLAQEGVDARWSGAVIAPQNGPLILEGVAGSGDLFMLGQRAPAKLPDTVESRVRNLYERASATLGAVRIEWVDDGRQTWVVQLHRGATVSSGTTIVPGKPARFRRFPVEQGIEKLREEVERATADGYGIVLVGDIGLTSHFGDVLRRANVPSYLERSN
jgi:hypothetical protein